MGNWQAGGKGHCHPPWGSTAPPAPEQSFPECQSGQMAIDRTWRKQQLTQQLTQQLRPCSLYARLCGSVFHCYLLWHETGFPFSSLDDGNWDSLTHRSGCNPHCVFLFLLSCIAFDVSVLLDFLISSETCFLEYFVRYLKLLIKDWHHFVRISGRFQPLLSRNPSFPLESWSGQEHASCQPDSRFRTASLPLQHTPKNRSALRHIDPQAAEPGSPEVWRGSDHEPTLGALQRLAEYESSEEDSGEERWAGARQAPLSRACTATGVGDHAQSVAQQESLPGQEVWTLSSPSYCRLALRSPGPGGGGVLERSVQCLQELQGSISRLHGKRLFPYNPAALLRLLAHLDCVS